MLSKHYQLNYISTLNIVFGSTFSFIPFPTNGQLRSVSFDSMTTHVDWLSVIVPILGGTTITSDLPKFS